MPKTREPAHLVIVTAGDVKKMNDDDVIIVNRSQINIKLASECRKAQVSNEKVVIMQNAVASIMAEEKEKKRVIVGASMRVKDVKKVFGAMRKMPNNSFMRLEV